MARPMTPAPSQKRPPEKAAIRAHDATPSALPPVMDATSLAVPPLEDRLDLGTQIEDVGATVGDFLAWAYSDVLDSMSRGALAEFLVLRALHVDLGVRNPGDPIDIRYRGGIQVKASSAVQRCPSDRVHRINFSIAPTHRYHPDHRMALKDRLGPKDRWGDCWVFAGLRPSILELPIARAELFQADAWRFWPVPTASLPKSATVSLGAVIANAGSGVTLAELAPAVERVMDLVAERRPQEAWQLRMGREDWMAEEAFHLVPQDVLAAVGSALEEGVVSGTPATHVPSSPVWSDCGGGASASRFRSSTGPTSMPQRCA